MFKDVRIKGKRKTLPIPKWHHRKVLNLHGAVAVTLPKELIDFERFRRRDPNRWHAGSQVRVAMTEDGRLVIELLPDTVERGFLHDPDVEDLDLTMRWRAGDMSEELYQKLRKRAALRRKRELRGRE